VCAQESASGGRPQHDRERLRSRFRRVSIRGRSAPWLAPRLGAAPRALDRPGGRAAISVKAQQEITVTLPNTLIVVTERYQGSRPKAGEGNPAQRYASRVLGLTRM